MQYTSHYQSPIGGILLAADGIGLTGLWFEGQKYFALQLDTAHEEREIPLFAAAKRWLDTYFSGKEPSAAVPLHFTGTDFQNAVWKILTAIPYGQTMSGAVGHNGISIIVPCHRVVGSNGSLTGYAGGIEKKRALLTLEGVDVDALSARRGEYSSCS